MHETARVEVVQRVAAANREIGHRPGGSTISRVGIRRLESESDKASSEGTTTKGRQARELTPRSRYRSRRERQSEVHRHIRARTASKPRVQTSTTTPPPVGTRPGFVKKSPQMPAQQHQHHVGVGSRLLELMKPDGVAQSGRVVPHGKHLYGDAGDGAGAAGFREESDTMGVVRVPADKYWGAQTQRSLRTSIGGEGSMRISPSASSAPATVNEHLGKLDSGARVTASRRARSSSSAITSPGCRQAGSDAGEHERQRGHIQPSHRDARRRRGSKPGAPQRPRQHVAEFNDTFPADVVATAYEVQEGLVPALRMLRDELDKKSREWESIVKIGRTHLMDAVPITLGQEFGGYAQQLRNSLLRAKAAMVHLTELAIGGTAVGTGLNSHPRYAELMAQEISVLTGLPFVSAPNKFESLAAHDAQAALSGMLKTMALSLLKISTAMG